jgi:hypothetical protein
MGVALEMACLVLRTGGCADDVKQAIANKIMPLPRPVNAIPMHSANMVLKDIRTVPGWEHRHPNYLTAAIARFY